VSSPRNEPRILCIWNVVKYAFAFIGDMVLGTTMAWVLICRDIGNPYLGKLLAKPTQGPFKIIDVQQLPINGTVLIQWSPTSGERVNIRRLLPFFERYNWGRECRTTVIFRYMTSQLNIQSPPILEDFRFATISHETHLIHTIWYIILTCHESHLSRFK
jgi:hypothetical protein